MIVEASAPSNIALIKYMGKLEGREGNLPTNSSLSWTLSHLKTFVRLSPLASGVDEWRALEGDELLPLELTMKSKDRFLRHFSFLKEKLDLQGGFLIESANNFPSDCGLASSASSFAALSLAAYRMSLKMGGPEREIQEIADYSRQGSGSSIRSFYGPWALWHSEGARPLEFLGGELFHQVVVVESQKKKVSSSEAHRRVANSELFKGRIERAEKRLALLLESLKQLGAAVRRPPDDGASRSHWTDAFEICWAEFWDMHALFETSSPPFGYMESGSLDVLQKLRGIWSELGDGPLVTMDAGANVHLLYRPDQKNLAAQIKKDFSQKWVVFASRKEES
jgi:diphosphomevalonate decarboxylase